MNEKLLIPKTIKVGYVERGDTYTKKLAYVIYYDTKGVLRKETSWEGWRNTQIPAQEFDNIPTEGFVLNKKAGGGNSGWNHRSTYCRVYDPRGFEFEISINNLLFILQECNSSKGKGLEGEFVYSWNGKDIVLLPVGSYDYKASSDFTTLQSQKISAKDLKPGCSYLTKDMDNWTYIGRFNYYNLASLSKDNRYSYYTYSKPSHIFYDAEYTNYSVKGKGRFFTLDSMTKLAKLNSDIEVSDYADIMDKFNLTKHTSLAERIVAEEYKLTLPTTTKSYYGSQIIEDVYIKIGQDKYQRLEIQGNISRNHSYGNNKYTSFSLFDAGIYEIKDNFLKISKKTSKDTSKNQFSDVKVIKDIEKRVVIKPDHYNYRHRSMNNEPIYFYHSRDIEKMDLLKIKIELKDGRVVEPKYYYED